MKPSAKIIPITVLLLCFSYTPLFAKTEKITIQNIRVIQHDETKLPIKIFLDGQVNLKNGSVLSVSLWFKKNKGLERRTIVRGGRWRAWITFPRRKKIIPGTYQIRVSFSPRLQSRRVYPRIPKALTVKEATQNVQLGDASKEKEEVLKVQKKLLNILEELRILYTEMMRRGGYFLVHLKIHNTKITYLRRMEKKKVEKLRKSGKLGSLDPNLPNKIANAWRSFFTNYWNTVYRAQRRGFRLYQKERFLSPYPEAEKSISHILTLLDKVFQAYTKELFKELRRPLPAFARRGRTFKRRSLESMLRKEAIKAYRHLGIYNVVGWEILDLNRREMGFFSNGKNTYRSAVSKFEITKPESWYWDFSPINYSVRLRIRPEKPDFTKKNAKWSEAIVVVEIFDYPQAQSFKDLRDLTEARSQNRYEGYQKISAKPISFPDPQVLNKPPLNGNRWGYDMLISTKTKNGEFIIRQYELFCQWHKRTYGVVCIVRKDKEKEYKKIFDKICRHFKVLDHPKNRKKMLEAYLQPPKPEKKKKEKKN
ncbi:MAG: hypothetical protein D6805_09960 [Planctomycetota bacterium]|nr:MAG: hypothetical protein D6805_09960 [Planctomycetota bacterium]